MSVFDDFYKLCEEYHFDPDAASTVASTPDYANRLVTFTKVSEERPGLVPVGHWTKGYLVESVYVGDIAMMHRYWRAPLDEGETGEVECEGYAQVNATYDLGYGSPNVEPAAVQQDQTLIGQGGYWDQFTWDQFTWDAAVVTDAQISIDGAENNINFLFYSSRAQDDPHTVQGVQLMYIPRRINRGGP